MVLQCPRCELRFDLRPMLADHLARDHDFTPESVAHLQPRSVQVGLPPAKRRDKPGDKASS